MNINSLSPKELRELADKKELEDRVVKIGYLKEDLYDFHSNGNGNGIVFRRNWAKLCWLNTKKEKENIIKDFKSRFELVLPAGTKFVCFLYEGREEWYDDVNYGLEGMDAAWAEKYLEKIINV